jgi:glycosyltransferase involved in cell wall biosynthesis
MSAASSGASAERAVPVSVVIPCYNVQSTLRRALASVTAQSARVLEVIAVDDASTDGTPALLRELQRECGAHWLKVIALERNQGASMARNAGWDAATGEYVAFLDADDTWDARKIAIQHQVMHSRPEVALSAHRHAIGVAPAPAEEVRISEVRARDLLWRNRFVTPSVMVRRSVEARFRSGQRHMEDHLLWMQLAFAGHRILLIELALATLYKAPFITSGLSADLVSMERAELGNYRLLWREGHIGVGTLTALSLWSAAKFARRLAIVGLRRRSA